MSLGDECRTMWHLRACALLLIGSALAACSDGLAKPVAVVVPTASTTQVATGMGTEGSEARDDLAIAAIPLPVNDSITSTGIAFRIKQKGTGRSGVFLIANTASASEALNTSTTGSGNAFSAQGATGRAALFTSTSGTETVGINGNSPGGAALRVTAFGPGGVSGQAAKFTHGASSSAGGVQVFQTTGAGSSMRIDQAGTGFALHVVVANTASPSDAVTVANNGSGDGLRVSQNGVGGSAAHFSMGSGNANSTLFSQTFGTGWAGEFLGSGASSRGVLITTQGGAGLQVVGGSKNAVVGTSSGARALYTEESSEVWFTDYGFGRLTNGRTRVSLDRTFSETVSLEDEYHVFVQSYGDADLVVRNRTAQGFDVVRRGAGEDARFSYRIVAKRKGFQNKRLERAPWADGSVRRGRVD